MGILGFSLSLAQEGGRKNILTNVVAPNAMTAMTKGIIPDDFGKNILTE